jgi:hypothetical protein
VYTIHHAHTPYIQQTLYSSSIHCTHTPYTVLIHRTHTPYTVLIHCTPYTIHRTPYTIHHTPAVRVCTPSSTTELKVPTFRSLPSRAWTSPPPCSSAKRSLYHRRVATRRWTATCRRNRIDNNRRPTEHTTQRRPSISAALCVAPAGPHAEPLQARSPWSSRWTAPGALHRARPRRCLPEGVWHHG